MYVVLSDFSSNSYFVRYHNSVFLEMSEPIFISKIPFKSKELVERLLYFP